MVRKRLLAVVTGVVMVASALIAAPASAQEAPAVPAEPNITDVSGDGNGLNDQGFGGLCVQAPACVPEVGDNSAGGIGAADILAVWFTNTDTTVSAHILTTFPPPNNTPGVGLIYRIHLNDNCTYLQGLVPSKTYAGAQKANVREFCGQTGTTEGGEISIAALEDGKGVTTLTYPLGLHPALVMDATLATPFASATAAVGTDSPALYAPRLDDTKVGTDYTISSGPPAEAEEPKEEEEPPGKSDPPGKGKKKGCGKGKGKQKGACKGKKPGKPAADVCPAYVPGEHGAEAEMITVTDAATEEKPVEIKFDAGVGLAGPLIGGVPVPPDQRTHNYHNLVVDSASAETGLYVRLQFKDRRDYDLYLEYPSGQEATHSGDFNPGHEALSCGSASTGCSSGSNFEQINGVRTKDCQGWTTDSVAYLTEGGEVTLTAWLGEIKVDPAAPEDGGQRTTALTTFWTLMGR